MLCLSAKEGDYVMIGEDIKLTFLKSQSGGAMYIGISAPRSMPIRRDKVYEKDLAERAQDPLLVAEEKDHAAELLRQNKKERSKAREDKYRRMAKHRRDEIRRDENMRQ